MLAAGPVAFRPPGIRFLGILSRRGLVPLLRSAYPSLMGSDPDGVSTFRACKMRPGWAPPLPRGQRCSHDQRVNSGRRLPPLPAARPYHPGVRPVVPGSALRGVTGGLLAFARPVFPSPGCSPDGTGALGLLPRASHPQQAGPVGRTSRWGLISNTDQELRLRHRRPPLREFTRTYATSCRTDPSQMCHSVTPTQAGADLDRSPRKGTRPVPMLAELVDAVVGVDTHRDTHEVEIALPNGAPIATCHDQQRHHRLRPAAGLDPRPRPRAAAGRVDRGHPQLRHRAGPRGRRRRPDRASSANNPTARPAAAAANPTRSTPTWPCWPRCGWTPTGCPPRAPTATARPCASCWAPATS